MIKYMASIVAMCAIAILLTMVSQDSTGRSIESLLAGNATNLELFFNLTVAALLFFITLLFVSPLGGLRVGRSAMQVNNRWMRWICSLLLLGSLHGILQVVVLDPAVTSFYGMLVNDTELSIREGAWMWEGVSDVKWIFFSFAFYAIAGMYFMLMSRDSETHSVQIKNRHVTVYQNKWRLLQSLLKLLTVVFFVISLIVTFLVGVQFISVTFGQVFSQQPLTEWNLWTIYILAAFAIGLVLTTSDNFTIRLSLLVGVTGIALLIVMAPLSLFNGPMTALTDFQSTWADTLGTVADREKWDWSQVFYWSFLVSLSPLAAIVVMNTSVGRSVREIILGVTIVPTLTSIVWKKVIAGLEANLIPLNTGQLTATTTTDIYPSELTFYRYWYEQPMEGFLIPILLFFSVILFTVLFYGAVLAIEILLGNTHLGAARISRLLWIGLIWLAVSMLIVEGKVFLWWIVVCSGVAGCLIMFSGAVHLYRMLDVVYLEQRGK